MDVVGYPVAFSQAPVSASVYESLVPLRVFHVSNSLEMRKASFEAFRGLVHLLATLLAEP